VLEAKAAGYTEPDPRDDLSGMDVGRKVSLYEGRRISYTVQGIIITFDKVLLPICRLQYSQENQD
jgi:aspartokinase/homoserine dehydrogenase 1